MKKYTLIFKDPNYILFIEGKWVFIHFVQVEIGKAKDNKQ